MSKKLTKREKMVYATLISLLIAILCLYTVIDVYAGYTTTLSGSGTVDIAKWNFLVNNVSSEEIPFVITIDSANPITVGSTGYFILNIHNDSNVNANYTIMFDENALNQTTATSCRILKLFTADDYETNGINIDTQNICGSITAKNQMNVKIYWKWISDDATQDQNIAQWYDSIKISAKVIGEQTDNANNTFTIVNK